MHAHLLRTGNGCSYERSSRASCRIELFVMDAARTPSLLVLARCSRMTRMIARVRLKSADQRFDIPPKSGIIRHVRVRENFVRRVSAYGGVTAIELRDELHETTSFLDNSPPNNSPVRADTPDAGDPSDCTSGTYLPAIGRRNARRGALHHRCRCSSDATCDRVGRTHGVRVAASRKARRAERAR